MKYIIYKIQINDYIYIGSTKNFTIRKSQHKRQCNNGKDLLVYRTIRDNGGWDYCSMIPIKEIDVETKIQANILEEEERIKYNAQMNTYRAHIPEDKRKEYERQRNQTEERKEYFRLRKQTTEYKEYDRECKRLLRQNPEYRECNKQYLKQYRLAKRDKLSSPSNL